MEASDLSRGNKNKIYFLIIVIAGLLGTIGYLFFKNKQQTEQVNSSSIEKDDLKLEVEKIEVELDRVNLLNITLNQDLITEQKTARDKIDQLKLALRKSSITKIELDQAYLQIARLKTFIKGYSNQIAKLQKDTVYLKNSRDSLKNRVKSITRQVSDLETENQSLAQKVKSASLLSIKSIDVVAFKTKSNGKKVEVTRASTAQKLSIRFNIVPNDLAEKTRYNIFLRVFDPVGNLLADDNNRFEADGQEMQYSHSIFIDYNNDNSTYLIDWTNPQPFIKGEYTVILYTRGKTLGKAQITLK
ncbi:FtsZ-binding cell division protein ZapB [Pedobacter sp. UYP30]|uniref:hypothetical protein n=1 Tax=Pedobacter sp. UYP30 TaxID=1756400 RepID=UPI003391F409